MKFQVTIVRKEYRSHTIDVEAEDVNAAEEAALDAIVDYDFHDSPITHGEEEVVGIRKVED
jgi:hypothetical protein